MTTVIVSGMVAATPGHGGASWAVLQYVLGLRQLGHDAYLVEPVDADDGAFARSARWCAAIMDRFGLADRWCLVRPGRSDTAGLDREALRRVAADADVVLNVSGMLADDDVLAAVPVRAYLDLDPGFIQLWHAVDGIDMRFEAHTHFVTVADAVGGPTIPDCGRHWLPTLPPVVLDHWPVVDGPDNGALTTVANWRGYGSIQLDGRHLGQKAHSLRPLFGLPGRTGRTFLLALGIHPDERDDVAALHQNGWELVDPTAVAATPDDYRRFVQGSWAEFGLAKSGYVATDSGWFSDRSACYLASGRPVIAQDTGFGRRLPVGEGLFSFADEGDVVVAIEEVAAGYERHRKIARELAEEHLDSRRVLRSLMDRLDR